MIFFTNRIYRSIESRPFAKMSSFHFIKQTTGVLIFHLIVTLSKVITSRPVESSLYKELSDEMMLHSTVLSFGRASIFRRSLSSSSFSSNFVAGIDDSLNLLRAAGGRGSVFLTKGVGKHENIAVIKFDNAACKNAFSTKMMVEF